MNLFYNEMIESMYNTLSDLFYQFYDKDFTEATPKEKEGFLKAMSGAIEYFKEEGCK